MTDSHSSKQDGSEDYWQMPSWGRYLGFAVVLVLTLDLLTKQLVPFWVFVLANVFFIAADEIPKMRHIGIREYLSRHQFSLPSLTDAVLVVVGLIAVYVSIFAATQVVEQLFNIITAERPESSGHIGFSTANLKQTTFIIYYILFFFLVVGPVEEYMFRHFVQRVLFGRFSVIPRVVGSSVIFSSAHIIVYGASIPGLISLIKIFALALPLGLVYEYTDNLTVPALIHAIYNSIAILVVYFGLV